MPGVSFAADMTLQVNTTGTARSGLEAGLLQITAAGASLVVAGQQLGGTFTVKVTRTPGVDATLGTVDDGRAVLIAVSGLTLQLGSFVNVTTDHAWTGALLVSDGGVAASFSGAPEDPRRGEHLRAPVRCHDARAP